MAEGWAYSGTFNWPTSRRETGLPYNKMIHICSKSSNLKDICSGIGQYFVFNSRQCRYIESMILDMVEKADMGEFKRCTVDRTLLRNKYFFGEGYTYGDCGGRESGRIPLEYLYPKDEVDPIPDWVQTMIIDPLERLNIIEKGFTNSVVINYYRPGGCIVSHIDPPHLFDRPIISVTFLSNSWLCFGCTFRFKPIRVSKPVIKIPLIRGWATSLSGFAANGITHCVRPQDTSSTRAVIILRRALSEAPRLTPAQIELYKTVNHSGIHVQGVSSQRTYEDKRKFIGKGLLDVDLQDEESTFKRKRKRLRLNTELI